MESSDPSMVKLCLDLLPNLRCCLELSMQLCKYCNSGCLLLPRHMLHKLLTCVHERHVSHMCMPYLLLPLLLLLTRAQIPLP